MKAFSRLRNLRFFIAAIVLSSLVVAPIAAATTNWTTTLNSGGGAQADAAFVTTATTTPTTFTAACDGSLEEATLTWTAVSGATGYQIMVSSTSGGTYAADGTQPSGTALTINETYTSSSNGDKYYRLEAKTSTWTSFPGATIVNAREATEGATLNGFLLMASSGTKCTVN
jgi:archaellum component FlaG (FlaF/FlaG flagellin family)